MNPASPIAERCGHFSEIHGVVPTTNGCEQCLALGATWTALRVCLTCGHVGCCEDSKYAHALGHFKSTGHPIIAPYERGETWSWCYVHHRYFELPRELAPKRHSTLARLFRRLVTR